MLSTAGMLSAVGMHRARAHALRAPRMRTQPILRPFPWLLGPLALLAGCGGEPAQAGARDAAREPMRAVCVLRAVGESGVSGTVTFKREG